MTPQLTLTSQTAYNQDHLYSTEDYNRFNTVREYSWIRAAARWSGRTANIAIRNWVVPAASWRRTFRASTRINSIRKCGWPRTCEGPVNFVGGANYLNYKTLEDYFVLSNAISLATEYFNSVSAGSGRAPPPTRRIFRSMARLPIPAVRSRRATASDCAQSSFGSGLRLYRSQSAEPDRRPGPQLFPQPESLSSEFMGGVRRGLLSGQPDVKLTGGLRYTDDRKSFDEIPSWTLMVGEGYPITGTFDQEWREVTGRFNVSWTPKLDFTDQSLFYASYAHGYKGGGANPPGVTPLAVNVGDVAVPLTSPSNQTHPLTFKPEFNNAFELGTKNRLLDGAMTLNGDVFFYKYQNYQISQIVDRTSVNLNFNATVRGAEVEATWEPIPGLRFNLSGGYERRDTRQWLAGHRSDGSHGGQSGLDRGQAVHHANFQLHAAH